MQEDQEEHIIEIEDENTSEEVDAVEEQETEDEVPSEQPQESASEEVPAEPQEASAEPEKSEEELAEYSESVQRRIRKLTAKFREEERQREAAIQYAEAVKKQNEQLQGQLRNREASYVDELGGRLDRELDAAKTKLKAAIEADDADGIFEAQQMVSRITIDQDKHADAKLRVERDTGEYQAPQIPQQAAQQAAPDPDPKAQAWADRNEWFGNDDTMTYAAFGIHRRLVEEEGFDPTSDEYYTELDKRIKGDFPQKFGQSVQPTQEEPKKAAKPRVASAESTASRSSNKGRRTVKLSPSQVAIAKKLGVPLEEYAKFVKE